jgi:hypothetical protein
MPIYPFLLALVPPLFLLAVNIQQVHTLAAWRLMLATLLITALVWLPLWRWLRRFERVRRLTRPLNIGAACALFLPLVLILGYGLPRDFHLVRSAHASTTGPDYFFIVLDSYTSHSELLERFGYDDSPFLDGLASLGFSTGECVSPATKTDESLAAMLNGGTAPEGAKPWEAIYHSELRAGLEAQGFQTWAFATGFVWTEILDADKFYQLPTGPFTPPTEFETLYVMQTPLRHVIDGSKFVGDRHRAHTLYLLEHLADAAADPGRQFVFAHILQPHPPFVFDADGNALNWSWLRNPEFTDMLGDAPEYTRPDYATGYVGQVEFVGAALLPALQEIIETSVERPYILVTGDHGAWYSEDPADAYKILCAEYK